MRRYLVALAALLWAASALAQEPVRFDDFFVDRALRLECTFVGDAKEELVTLDHVAEEACWPETRTQLADPFNNGRYELKVYDVASNRLIYSKGFDAMFGEYTTTSPALAGVKKSFERSVRIPCPKHPVLVVIEKRDKTNLLGPLFAQRLDPADVNIVKESGSLGDFVFDVLHGGEPSRKVDLVFLAEGYTAQERDKFKADAERFAGWLFEVEPYRSLKDRFNIRGVMRPSQESGSDEPRQGVFRKTNLNASFNAFDLDRYQLTEEGRELRRMASQVPYDAIVVLVNSKRYGGGGIYGDYCLTTVDNERSRGVFLHEFGHAFAGLADEYYLSEVAYNDFYPKGVEPLEPNITAYLSPDQLKWKDLLSPGIAIPTDWGKEKIEALDAERKSEASALETELAQARQKGLPEAEIARIKDRHDRRTKEIEARLAEVRKSYAAADGKVGLFEGAGYSAKGLYRPMVNCLMFSNSTGEFCRVCQRAIRRAVDYYSGE